MVRDEEEEGEKEAVEWVVEEGRWWRRRKKGRRRMEKEITRRWTTRFAWKLVSVLAKSYYALSFSPFAPFIPSFSPPVLSSLPFSVALPLLRLSLPSLPLSSLSLIYTFSLSLWLSTLALFPSPYLFPSETSRCVRTNTSEKSFTLTNTDASSTSRIRPRLSFSVSHSPSLFLFPLFSLSLLSSSLI